MRWGDWVMQNADTLVNMRTKTIVSVEVLYTPASVDAWLWGRVGCQPELTLADGIHLHIAANDLVWRAFDYAGVGDWIDLDGLQLGKVVANGR